MIFTLCLSDTTLYLNKTWSGIVFHIGTNKKNFSLDLRTCYIDFNLNTIPMPVDTITTKKQ